MKFKKRNIQIVDHSTGQTLDFPTFGKQAGEEAINELEQNVDNKIAELKSLVGTPLKASTASAMNNRDKIYVYTGNETGYTNGHWYYHDGSKWVDGGVYNSTAVETDKTLSVENMPADAKKTGDEINTLKSELNVTYPSSILLDKNNYYFTGITNKSGKITKATWQADSYIVYTGLTVSEGQVVLVHVDNRSINGISTTTYGALTFFDSNDQQIGTAKYIRYSDADPVTGAVNFRTLAPTDSAKVNITIYGISNYSSTIGDNYYINGACVFIGQVESTNVKRLTNKINLNSGWVHGGYFSGGFVSIGYRVSLPSIIVVPVDFLIDIKSNYKYGVIRYNSTDALVSDTGWLTGKHAVFAGERITITIARSTENSSETVDIAEFLDAITFYPCADPSASADYYYYGEKIETKKHGLSVVKLGVTRQDPSDSSLVAQGGAIYSGKLFQAYKNDYVQIYDIATGQLINSFAMKCDHGDCISFSGEFYSPDDDYPLLYATSDSYPAKVYINRVTNSGSTLIKTLVFPESAGYYGGHALDAVSNKLYLIAYANSDYRTDANGNHMIVTAWDLTNLTNNGDDTYTPELLSTFTLPFVYCCQDQDFYNGKIFVLSSFSYTESLSKIVVIDPDEQRISNEITHLPTSITNTEDEMISFYESNDRYNLAVGSHTLYSKIDFM